MRIARGIGLAAMILGAGSPAHAQDDAAAWFGAGGTNESGMAVLLDAGKRGVDQIAVKDAAGAILDETNWTVAAPFLRAYTLRPGTYEVFLPEPYKPVTVSVEPGKQAYIEALNDKEAIVTYYPTMTMIGAYNEALGKDYTNLIGPKNLDTATNRLYFTEIPIRPAPPPPDE